MAHDIRSFNLIFNFKEISCNINFTPYWLTTLILWLKSDFHNTTKSAFISKVVKVQLNWQLTDDETVHWKRWKESLITKFNFLKSMHATFNYEHMQIWMSLSR